MIEMWQYRQGELEYPAHAYTNTPAVYRRSNPSKENEVSYMGELERIERERNAVQRKIGELEVEVRRLNFEHTNVERSVDLPTDPGWYVTADNTPARLEEDGTWHDGWGNSGPDYDPVWHPLPLTRMIPKENNK